MSAITLFWEWFCYVSGVLCAISLALYLLPLFYLSFLAGKQDLRKKYHASWAVVTGGSSGIGKQVVRELAMQVCFAEYTLTESVSFIDSKDRY